MPHEPVMHPLDEKRIVAEIADAPFGITHGLAMPCGKVAMPFQSERRLQEESVPAFLGRALMPEVVDVEADVVDDIVAGISKISGAVLRPPSRTPIEAEACRRLA